ncbi:MAG: lactate utilization protein [Candidatus Kaiserbacteria bacterium]|nr:lactate utilization protein [Candidatus Kaiserbacteria bacterium]
MDYSQLASTESIAKTAEALKANRFSTVVTVANGAAALEYIKENLPKGVSVMNGASRTLEQIGFVDYLKGGAHGWNNLHAAIVAETDPAKQAELRRNSVSSDYYLGSVHAVTETGELVISSNTGSQLPHLAFTSQNLVLVVGTQKIVPTLAEAMTRFEYILPLENENMMQKYGVGTQRNKTLILHGESGFTKRNVTILFVNEKLGF